MERDAFGRPAAGQFRPQPDPLPTKALPTHLEPRALGEHEHAVLDHLRGHTHNSAVCEICRLSTLAHNERMRFNEIIGG